MPLDRRESPENRADLRTLTLTLTVSLFIAMLAFFIVLNSYASDDRDRISKLKVSITGAFGIVGQGRAAQANSSNGSGSAGNMEVVTSAALRSVLPNVGFKSSNSSVSGHVMQVTMTKRELDENWIEIKSRLTDLLTHLNPGGRYHLQILSYDGTVDPSDLASLAATLEQNGVDARLLAVGIEPHGKTTIELRFVRTGG